ncbi:MAG: glycosyltransferase family 1 protein [Propioniciclava sp.]|uniref:glycosyltransferase family 4 protein n=1 Tax=Propioniciclava sp. TaxID=2038686 RepID=UPI0039E46D7B
MSTRILVDLLFFTGTRGGMETVARRLYSSLPDDVLGRVELVGLASRELARQGADWFPGELIDSRIPSSSAPVWAVAELLAGAWERRVRPDVIHSPANFGPWLTRAPRVVTIHDLLSFRHPEYVPGRLAAVQRALLRGTARAASRVITVSEASAADIVGYLGVAPGKIDVVPPAGSGRHAEPGEREDRLLFSLGNRLPHKNFPLLLEALALIEPSARPGLVLPGGGAEDPLAPLVERLGLGGSVRLAGWLAQSEVDRLYARATALVFPTRFEGFGLPVLEAMSAGCPVLCSDLPVLREVGADAAAYVDTTSAERLAEAITALLADAPRRAELSASGIARAAEFSWEATARGTIASLERAAADGVGQGRSPGK